MRFYFPKIANSSRIELTGEAHTHAAYSLRIHPGDSLTIFDGSGIDYSCKVADIKKDRTILEVLDTAENPIETKTDVTLYMSVIKPDKFELTVQKITELGVKTIVPVYTEYAQRNIKPNYDRLNKIVVSACEQCGRSRIPAVRQAIDFKEMLQRVQNTYMIFPWEREAANTLKSAIDATKTEISVFVGPEGGISKAEANALVQSGARSVTLGKRILRAETAAISILSALYYEMGEWNV